VGTDLQTWRVEVQQTLHGLTNVFAGYRERYQWEPQSDSPAALALAREEEFAGAWSDEPVGPRPSFRTPLSGSRRSGAHRRGPPTDPAEIGTLNRGGFP
jgi:hypothetical protein